MAVTWAQALTWRLGRQLLEPVGQRSVADVVGRLGAVPAHPAEGAELAVGVRRKGALAGDVTRALAEGEIVHTYLFRGARHLITPQEGAAYLTLRASGRQWELPSWQQAYGLRPADWPGFREAVRDALAEHPLTRGELMAAVSRRRGHRSAAAGLVSESDTLLKALMWQGDVCFGLPRDGHATLQRLDANPRWPGPPDVDEAGRRAVEEYLRAYGPATLDRLHYWLGEGLSAGRKAIVGWVGDLAHRLATVDVEGEEALVCREDLDDLVSTSATSTVHLLPGHDQWVMGPGTADAHVVPPEHRPVVTRGANLVVVDGVVSGTWVARGKALTVEWFAQSPAAGSDALGERVARVEALLGFG